MTNKMNALDYANASAVSIAGMKKAGVVVVQRYLFESGKGITASERKALLAAGIGIVYGFEGFASNWRGGAAQGRIDGARAAGLAKALGVRKGTAIHYAIDEDAGGLGMLPTALAYVTAAGTADYPSRAYGSYAVLEYIKRPGFQTYAWSGGRVSKYASLYQWLNGQYPSFGGPVDFDEVLNFDTLSAEWPAKSVHKPPATAADATQKEETEMLALFRAVILGGRYETDAIKKARPGFAHAMGLLPRIRNQEKQIKAIEKANAAMAKRLAALEAKK